MCGQPCCLCRRLLRLVAPLRVDVKDGRAKLVLALVCLGGLWRWRCLALVLGCSRCVRVLLLRFLQLSLQTLEVLKGRANYAHPAAARELLGVGEGVGIRL